MSKTNNKKEIFAHAQILGFQSLEESPFIHHHALSRQKPIKERFVADINIASPDFPSLIKKMDDFILKYNAQFKVVNQRALNRSDTMNVYMQENITSQIAEEFYKIVKPCLCKDNHDKLDGFEIMQGSTPIKGIKIGPELDENKQAYLNRKRWVNKTLARDIHSPALREKAENYLEKLIGHSSLGEKACALQLMDLMYYAMDRGSSPFRYISYDGSFYDKKLTIPNNEEKNIERAPVIKEPKQSFWKRLFTKKKKKTFHWDDPIKWKDVMTTSSDGEKVNFGHRINISTLTEEERNQIREGLDKYHIQFSERQATKKGDGIEVGDWTIRVSDPKSIEQLRSIVFQWATGIGTRPISMTKEDFERQQLYLRELSGRSSDKKEFYSKKNEGSQEKNQENLILKKKELNEKSA
jgi:hypothetical protein